MKHAGIYNLGESLPGIRRVEQIMGLPIIVDIRDETDGGVIERVFDWFRSVDAVFSTYKWDSDISRLNRGEVPLADIHPDVRAVLQRCEQLRWETAGFFDIRAPRLPPPARSWDEERVPFAVDPTGLVKGWSVDRAGEILDAAGLRNYSINAGGDIRLRGAALPADIWHVGIQHPFIRDAVAVVVEANDLCIATSGTYERGNHIINPHTDMPPEGVLSVTVTGPDLGTADAYATAIYAMGPAGIEWAAQLENFEAMVILADERVISTSGFPTAGE